MSGALNALAGLRQHGAPGGFFRRLVSSRLLTTVFVLVLVTAGSCLYIWQRVRALDLLADVGRFERLNREYRDQLMKVDADISQLESLSRIDSLAQTQFGLRQVELTRLYAVRFPEQSVGENGMEQLWNAVRRSVSELPTIQSAEVAAQELFDEEN
ncbi:MAG TPA: hypothetical protein VLB27_11620 [candidate division Zixibacteria bacterium]|nr:hypothetical protein [candidate division Zixibacteria bacterium]